MRNNPTAYQHPTIQRKIKIAALKAWFDGRKTKPSYRSKQYVANRHGNYIMRIDYSMKTGFTVYGDQSRNITNIITPIISALN